MSLTPLEIQKTRFAVKRKGYDPAEVESFLALVAEELTARLSDLDRLQRENRFYAERARESDEREHQLQETLVRGQKVAEEMIATSQREAQLLLKEAEIAADRTVEQALEQATHIEGRMQELRAQRRELQLRFKNTLDLFRHMLEADVEEERSTATYHTLARARRPPQTQQG